MQLNTDLIHNSDLQVTKLISQSIAVSSLKEQKGHSYLISLRKPKPGAERALSVTVAGPPSVLDCFLTPQSPAHPAFPWVHDWTSPNPARHCEPQPGHPSQSQLTSAGISPLQLGTTHTWRLWNGITQCSSPWEWLTTGSTQPAHGTGSLQLSWGTQRLGNTH